MVRWYLTINEHGRHIQDAEKNEDNYICNVESTDNDAILIEHAPALLEACDRVQRAWCGDGVDMSVAVDECLVVLDKIWRG